MGEQQGVAAPIGAKTLNQECIPPGPRPSGARIKVVKANGDVGAFWDFDCDNLASAFTELQRLKKDYCDDGNKNAVSGKAGEVELDPFFETSDQERTINLKGPNGDFLFFGKRGPPAANRLTADDLANVFQTAFSGCCL